MQKKKKKIRIYLVIIELYLPYTCTNNIVIRYYKICFYTKKKV